MSRRPTTKRKRYESTRSEASGISALSNLTQSADDLNDTFEACSPTPRCNCNNVTKAGSRSDLINVVQPQIFCDANRGVSERRVSFGLSDDEEETCIKEINSQSNFMNGNRSNENFQFQHQRQCVDVYAQAQIVPQSFGTPSNCQSTNCVSKVPNQRHDTLEKELEILRRKHAEQQKKIAFLLEKDKRRERFLHKQSCSASVTSLQASAMKRGQENYLQEFAPRRLPANIEDEVIMRHQHERTFIFPNRNPFGVSQRRSRSCDFLLDREEREQFPVSSPEESPVPVEIESSGYEKGARYISDTDTELDSSNNEEDQLQKAKWFNFRRGFALLLLLNAIIVTLNIVGIPLFSSVLKDQPEEIICIDCSSINQNYVTKFRKLDEKCCLDSASEMLDLFLNVTDEMSKRPLPPQAQRSVEELPMIQYKARKMSKIGNVSRITWQKDKQNPVQKGFSRLNYTDPNDQGTIIRVPQPGIYFIYSNIQFVKNNREGVQHETFGHSIVKLGGKVMESATETCFPSKNEIRHNSHLSFMHEFDKNESLYVKLHSTDHFNADGTKFGMFFVKRNPKVGSD